MKRFIGSAIVTVFLGLGSASASTQHIACFPMDTVSSDRAVVSLDASAANGTLFRTGGLNYWGEMDSTGVLKLVKREETVASNVYAAEDLKTIYTVEVPKDVIGKMADEVYVKLSRAEKTTPDFVVDETMFCYSRVYSSAL